MELACQRRDVEAPRKLGATAELGTVDQDQRLALAGLQVVRAHTTGYHEERVHRSPSYSSALTGTKRIP
jgi:hypothetical protein